MPVRLVTAADVRAAEPVIRRHCSPAPLIRSYPLEQALGLPASRRAWIKDFGWTPAGSFKLLGGLHWMHHHAEEIRRGRSWHIRPGTSPPASPSPACATGDA